MRLKMAYGREGLWIDVPDGMAVTVIEPQFVAGLRNESEAVKAALYAPLAGAPLPELVSATDTVAIVFSDITRPMPNDRVIPILLESLQSIGVPDQHICLINALGTHRAQSTEELGTDVDTGHRAPLHHCAA